MGILSTAWVESHDVRVRSSSRKYTVDEKGDNVPRKGTRDEDVIWATWSSTEEMKQCMEKKGVMSRKSRRKSSQTSARPENQVGESHPNVPRLWDTRKSLFPVSPRWNGGAEHTLQ